MQETPYLTVELVWEDTDLEELCISANNGQFSGEAKVYFAQGDVQLLADSIRGFPKTTSQRETFSGGNEADPPFAQLVFRCADGSGHATVHVALAEIVYHNGRPFTDNRVELELPFEPNALDDFCRELDLVARRATRRAVLRGLGA
jgi:hypothetical protein